jgi:large subunit ribosomal protein L25
MDQLTLKVTTRTEKPEKLRAEEIIPAVFYGHGIDSMSIQVPYSEFQKLYREAGESTIITLDIDGKEHNAIIKDVQLEHVKDTYMHVDFYAVRMDEEITAEVELAFVGMSKAVKEEDGILVKNFDAVEVTCLPGDLPSEIEVDISVLETFEEVIAIKDLAVSSKVEISQDADAIVATVTPPRSEEELEALNEEITEDVESVEGVKKEEEGDEEGDAEAGEKKEKGGEESK